MGMIAGTVPGAIGCEAMGQELFAPPNVKGWPGGKAWLNTSTCWHARTSPRPWPWA